jgi:hypothetical protein
MTFDLDTLDATTELTFDVPVVFDDVGAAVAGFKVVGKNSTQYQDAKRKQDVVAVKKSMIRGGRTPDAKTDAGAQSFIDDNQARDVAIATACVTDWYGFSKSGADVPLTADALKGVFEKRPTWLEKVISAISTDANFTQG